MQSGAAPAAAQPSSIPARSKTVKDVIAGTLTALVLLPQAVAYAQLAGLPVSFGLAASMLPPLVYALFGSSRVLAVGPVSVASVMVAHSLAGLHPDERLIGALVMSIEVGLILLALGFAGLGLLVNFVSHPVLSGFTAAAAIQIVLSQGPELLGFRSSDTPLPWAAGLFGGCLLGAMLALKPLADRLQRGAHHADHWASYLPRVGPLAISFVAAAFLAATELAAEPGFAIVGAVASVLPWLSLAPLYGAPVWLVLLPSAASVALIAYLESVAIAKAMATPRRERIEPNRELLALGAANVVGGFSGAMPVAGGFSRTVVNVAAGANSQLAAVVTAIWLTLVSGLLPGLIAPLPRAALAAIVIAAVLPLIKLRHLYGLWRYDRNDGLAGGMTLLGVLVLGIKAGLALGIVIALLLHLWRSSRPHIAIIGRVPGTGVFRNIERHEVETFPGLLLIRIDEGLSFANADYVQQFILDALSAPTARDIRSVVLVCSAVNHIDASGLEMLEGLHMGLKQRGVRLLLTEVKGPVQDRLQGHGHLLSTPFEITPSLEATLDEADPPNTLALAP